MTQSPSRTAWPGDAGGQTQYIDPTGKPVWTSKEVQCQRRHRTHRRSQMKQAPSFKVKETLNVDASNLSVVKNSQHTTKDGRHFTFVVQKDGKQAAVVDGVAGAEYEGEVIAINLSPDDKRVSYYVLTDNKRKWQAVVDGQVSPVYDVMGELTFSPDSKRVGYIVQNQGRLWPVVDGVAGQEYALGKDEYGMPDCPSNWLVFSPDESVWSTRLRTASNR